MTYVKKLRPEWEPQEHPGILVGDIVDFPGNVEKLIRDGDCSLCDEYGNEISAYEALGMITDRELAEFRAYKQMQQQQALKSSLESEHDTLLARAKEFNAGREVQPIETVTPQPVGTVEEAKGELEVKRRDWAAKMAAARAAKKAQAESTVTVATS